MARPALRAASWSLSHWELGKRRISPREVSTVADWTFEDNVLTNNRAEFERYAALVRDYPDLALGGVTWAWMDAAMREMRALADLPDNAISEPMLIFSAEEEAVVSNEAIDALVARNAMVTLVHLQDCRHEPFVEEPAVQAVLWREIETFLDRVAPVEGASA
jgi:lysophospholipase